MKRCSASRCLSVDRTPSRDALSVSSNFLSAINRHFRVRMVEMHVSRICSPNGSISTSADKEPERGGKYLSCHTFCRTPQRPIFSTIPYSCLQYLVGTFPQRTEGQQVQETEARSFILAMMTETVLIMTVAC